LTRVAKAVAQRD